MFAPRAPSSPGRSGSLNGLRAAPVVVVDAGCLVAGVLAPAGATSELLELWREGGVEVVVCPNLLEEVRRALKSPRIAARYGLEEAEINEFIEQLEAESMMFPDPTDPPRAVPGDPNDDYLVALTIESEADCLVTRDKHFDGVRIKGVRITTPGRLLKALS